LNELRNDILLMASCHAWQHETHTTVINTRRAPSHYIHCLDALYNTLLKPNF